MPALVSLVVKSDFISYQLSKVLNGRLASMEESKQNSRWRCNLLRKILDRLWDNELKSVSEIIPYRWWSFIRQDTTFEIACNTESLIVVSKQLETACVLFRIIRMIIDNNHDLLDRDYEAFLKERETHSLDELILYLGISEHGCICKSTSADVFVDADLWNIPRILNIRLLTFVKDFFTIVVFTIVNDGKRKEKKRKLLIDKCKFAQWEDHH